MWHVITFFVNVYASGNHAILAVSGETATLSWLDVFSAHPGQEITYLVNLGTREGYTDILRQAVRVPGDDLVVSGALSGDSIYCTIRAEYATGEHNIYKHLFRIKKEH
jgi:hypothetical protein